MQATPKQRDAWMRGAYANAYESTDFDKALEMNPAMEAEREAFMVGFYSCYELDEIDDEMHRAEVAFQREKYEEWA